MTDYSSQDLRDSSPSESGYITVAEVIRAAVDLRWIVITCVVSAAAIAVVIGFVVRPLYQASVVVIPADSIAGGGGSLPGQLAGLASLAGVQLSQPQDPSVEALAVLQSRQFSEAFIADKNLLPIFFADRWDEKQQSWNVSGAGVPTMADGFRIFDDSIRTVSQDRRTGIVTLTIRWTDREAVAQWANELLARLNAVMRQRTIVEADARISVLQERLRDTNVLSLQQALSQLLEAEIRLRTVATVQEDYVFRIVDPAIAPDEDDVVFPRKALLAAGGALLGLTCGAILVLVRALRRKQP